MDVALTKSGPATTNSRALLVTALAPVMPQILGSAFNIWYNAVVVDPLLITPLLKQRFMETVIFYNSLVYPMAIGAWLWVIFSLREPFQRLLQNQSVEPQRLERVRRRVIHLPLIGAAISAAAWFLCIPVFIGALGATGDKLGLQLLWHLPISFAVSAFISITQSFFLIELASHWGLFTTFFADVRPDRLERIYPLSLRGRGLMWAISAGVCPISSLLLLSFAPPSSAVNPQWFQLFVGVVGIAFGLLSAILIARLVAKPLDQLRAAAQQVAAGRLDVNLHVRRADEFGALIGDFNQMVMGLREKERLRKTFGIHVGRKAAEQILARDPGVGGTEEIVTVMFVDIRSFTSGAEHREPRHVVALLNEFLRAMVGVVETEHGGMVNKFLGDGFMAVFGIGGENEKHADDAVAAGCSLLRRLEELNADFTARGELPLAIGVGLNTGLAIVGSIGSPERMEFTVIGNAVNLASRIEAMTKTLGCPMLLSFSTRNALRAPIALREFPPQEIRGIAEPVPLFAPNS